MIKEGLLGEFIHETENTRKLLNAIPDDVLGYRPQPHLWTLAELAQHIAGIYQWYDGVYNYDVFDLAAFKEKKDSIEDIASIRDIFEKNAAEAQKAIEKSEESSYFNDWTLKSGDHILIGPIKKIGAIRGFLCSHLYHHRGEMIAYLRVNGCKVPGLYGSTYEESLK